MPTFRTLDDDAVRLRRPGASSRAAPLATLFWGDRVKEVDRVGGKSVIDLSRQEFDPVSRTSVTRTERGELPAGARFRASPLLRVHFVDVGPGDA